MNRVAWTTLLVGGLLLLTPLASAHYFRPIDSARKIWLRVGWDQQPVQYELGSITVLAYYQSNGTAVSGLNLNITLKAGQYSKTFPLPESDDNPGNYTLWLIPTISGFLNSTVTGTYGSTHINVTGDVPVEGEPAIGKVSDFEFPVAQPDPGQLAAQVAQLQAQYNALNASYNALKGSNSASGKIPGFEAPVAVLGIGATALLALVASRRR
jgi:hypothetical protein